MHFSGLVARLSLPPYNTGMTFDELPEDQKEYFLKAEKQGFTLGKILVYLIGLAIAVPLFIFKHPIIACFVIVIAILAPHSREAKKSILDDIEFSKLNSSSENGM